MKKGFAILMIATIVLAGMFVSCTNEIDDAAGQSRSIRFSTGDEIQSKGLTSSLNAIRSGDYYWTYTAEKADDSGLDTGASEVELPVTKSDSGEHEKGLDGIVGPFSLGRWNFTLNAYADLEKTQKVYSGNIEGFVLTRDTASIRVAVEPCMSQEHTGKLVIPEIPLSGLTGSKIEIITITNLESREKLVYDNDPATEASDIPENRTFDLPSGQYKVNIVYRSVDTDPVVEYANNNAYPTVYDFLVTEIGGSMDEKTTSTKFESVSGAVVATSPDITVVEGEDTNLVVDSSPAQIQGSTAKEEKTRITIPSGVLDNDSKANVSVTSYKAPEAAGKYQVSTEDGVVAAIDIVVTADDVRKTEFGGEAVTVTTYVAKNLPGTVSVRYQDDLSPEKQPTDVVYDAESGKLTFNTTHLSEFYVIADVEAMNMDTGVAYGSLSTAAMEAEPGETIVLTKDIKADSKIVVKVKGANIDGLRHSVSGEFNFAFDPVLGGKIENVRFYDISNAKNDLSPIYASQLKGKVVVSNNEFHAADWDVIQIVPNAGAEIVIENNFFEHKPTPGADVEETPNRYIHIESRTAAGKYDQNCDFSVVIKGNTMLDCASLRNCGIEVYWPSNAEKVEISDNYIDDPFAVCIMTKNSKPAPELVLPFAPGPDGEPAYEPVAYYDKGGNYYFCDDLDKAVAAVQPGSKIKLVKDVTLEEDLELGGVILDVNGHELVKNGHKVISEIGKKNSRSMADILKTADELRLVDDLSVNGQISIDKNLTLDLNGHMLNTNTPKSRPIKLSGIGTALTVDGTKSGSGMTCSNGADAQNQSYGIFQLDDADQTLTLNGGTYTGTTENGALVRGKDRISNQRIILNDVTAETNYAVVSVDCAPLLKVEVHGGSYTISGTELADKGAFYLSSSGYPEGPWNNETPDIVFDGVEINTDKAYGVQIQNALTTFKDCNINVAGKSRNAWGSSALIVSGRGAMIVDSGNYESLSDGLSILSTGGRATINGGNISGTENSIETYSSDSLVTINGGSLTGNIKENNGMPSERIKVCGGTFSVDPTAYVVDGYEAMASEPEGTWTVQVKAAEPAGTGV